MIVLLPQELVISDPIYSDDGALLGGHVENGVWTLRIEGEEFVALDGTREVNRWRVEEFLAVPMDDDFRGGYREAIELAHASPLVDWARSVKLSLTPHP